MKKLCYNLEIQDPVSVMLTQGCCIRTVLQNLSRLAPARFISWSLYIFKLPVGSNFPLPRVCDLFLLILRHILDEQLPSSICHSGGWGQWTFKTQNQMLQWSCQAVCCVHSHSIGQSKLLDSPRVSVFNRDTVLYKLIGRNVLSSNKKGEKE